MQIAGDICFKDYIANNTKTQIVERIMNIMNIKLPTNFIKLNHIKVSEEMNSDIPQYF